jgi:DNA-binding beta-propeller fold protein YncE
MRRIPWAGRIHVRRSWPVALGVLALLLLSAGIASAIVPPAFVTAWGTAGSGAGQFRSPWGIAVDGSGNVYVADSNPIPDPSNDRIQKFTSSGGVLTTWGTTGSGNGQFSGPTSVAVDGSGNVYVADQFNHRIQKFTSSGGFITKWGAYGTGNGQFKYPVAVAVSSSGNVYVADDNRIQKFTSSGAFITKWGSIGYGNGQFHFPGGIAVDGPGNVYVTDVAGDRVEKFTSSGGFLTAWSTWSGNGQFNAPRGIAVDGSGNVYVADAFNHRVVKFTSSGVFLTKWGTSGSGPGQFKRPRGVAVDSSGCVYVTDTNNHRVQKFCYLAPPKPPSLDHFQCYLPRKTTAHLLGVASLQDQFDGKKFEQVEVTELSRFCNPVRKVFSGKVTPIAHDKLHLAIYSIATKPTGNHSLLISNQFGQQKILVGPPRWLAVPTSKNSTTPPDTKLLSHFKCYPVVKGKSVNVAVDLTDQWSSDKGVRVGLQAIFCNPARKIHAGKKYPIVNTAAHLLCYRLGAKPIPKSAFILNQFGQADIAVVGADLLCVPSRILGAPPPPPPPPPPAGHPPPPPPPPPAQDACAEFPKTLVSGVGNTAYSTDGGASFPNIAFAVSQNPIWNVIGGTSWVSLTKDGRSPSQSSTTVYRRSFDVPRYTLDHAVLSLSGSMLADNSAKVSFNGQTLAQQPSGSPTSNYKTPTPFAYQGSPGKTSFQLSDDLDFTVTDQGEATGVDYSLSVTCKAG